MSKKSTPFKIVVHFTGQKSNQEVQSIVDDFYISQIQRRLNESNIKYDDKIAIVDKLILHHSLNT